LALNTRGPRGFATDGSHYLYLAGPPAPGSASSSTTVQRYDVTNGDVFDFSTTGTNPDGSQQPYGFVFGLALDPSNGTLYVEDDANAVAPPNGTGHIWRVGSAPAAGAAPSQPSITQKPGNPTNVTSPSFAFSSATAGSTFQCSFGTQGSPASFSACTSPFTPPAALADGSSYTFAVQAVNAAGTSTPASYTFAVDTTAPTMSITDATATGSTVTAHFTSSETVSAQCALTTAAPAPADFAPCASPQTYTKVVDGTYTFSLKGSDLAGNSSATVTSGPIIVSAGPAPVDATATAPVQTFALNSVATATAVPVTLTWTGDANATAYELQQSTNGGAFV
ncbi:MAG TPA: Ig-like domain-containing protein, partial [Mycobacteriales bacterium]|nr:Ig-like domain-containing protein [Mycobacteriales bacterium]